MCTDGDMAELAVGWKFHEGLVSCGAVSDRQFLELGNGSYSKPNLFPLIGGTAGELETCDIS